MLIAWKKPNLLNEPFRQTSNSVVFFEILEKKQEREWCSWGFFSQKKLFMVSDIFFCGREGAKDQKNTDVAWVWNRALSSRHGLFCNTDFGAWPTGCDPRAGVCGSRRSPRQGCLSCTRRAKGPSRSVLSESSRTVWPGPKVSPPHPSKAWSAGLLPKILWVSSLKRSEVYKKRRVPPETLSTKKHIRCQAKIYQTWC